eukprot:TRINITY_DN2842_c1_g2_i4.p1 TRINITY_DN2842_c1_g2~~TRINITY_DN2842_c1_g2_i4.p1  ORF type:complete len:548 (+),score=125.92 TRINITY_DN2842_c1_g2_i4:277-1920(+)
MEFSTVEEAENAIKNMNGQSGWTVHFANNDARTNTAGDQTLYHGSIYVGQIGDTTEKALEEEFAKFGTVESVILRGEDGAKYAFVKMMTIAAAARAIDGLANHGTWLLRPANTPGGKDGMMPPMMGGFGGKGGWKGDPWGFQMAAMLAAPWMGLFGGGGFGKGFMDKGSGKGAAPKEGVAPTEEQQRGEGPPNDNLYVKHLPLESTEDSVREIFAGTGRVVECRVIRYGFNFTGNPGCAALVRFATTEMAQEARDRLDGTPVCCIAKNLEVTRQRKDGGESKDHVYVKNLPAGSTEKQLETVFGEHGKVLWCRMMDPRNAPAWDWNGEKTALVQLESEEEVVKAIEALHGKSTKDLGFGQPIMVRFSHTKEPAAEIEEVPSCNLYLKGWPVGFPENLLSSIFDKYGTVSRIRILTNPDPSQPTCAALVQMGSTEEATAAKEALNNKSVECALPPMGIKYVGRDHAPSDNLYVSALPRGITADEIRETFGNYGEITQLKLLDNTGRTEAHALVKLTSAELAADALRDLNGKPPVFKLPALFIAFANKR